MKITKISLHQVYLPLKEGSYSWSTYSFSSFDSTIVLVETDAGIIGVGEICPLGPSYLPAYAEGARAGLVKVGRGLLGQDPRQLGRINSRMDELLKGHPYVKSALDMACWDILGKACDQPVYNLLGGRYLDKVKLFKVVSRQEPDAMAKKIREYQDQGFKQFQMKVGAGVDADIERIRKVSGELRSGNVLAADANTGWRQHEAIRLVKEIRDVDIYIEQPCLAYEECLAVRKHSDHPMILDECMEDVRILMRGCEDQAMDLVNLKISRVGGLTKARQFRDLAVTLGIVLTIEDTWGGEIATAAIAHLAHSTPNGFHFQSSAFNEYHSLAIASGAPRIEDGYMAASNLAGLGVTPDMNVLGDPVTVIV
jgi:L-alanine-DL-glutamate epimerase-like enolase superfamily enzyme